MLTRKEIRHINRFGVSTLHNYWVMSLYAGEPFFKNSVLAYYDGRLVTICGFPLRGAPPIYDDVIRRLALSWVLERNVESILYVGPRPLNLNCLGDYKFRRITLQRRRIISSELFIECNDNSGSVFERRVYSRSQSMGFECKIKAGGIISAEHMTLIEQFYRKRGITGYLAAISFALPALLQSRRVWIIEARKDGFLRGFLALHKAFTDIAIGLFLAHDNQTPGVSDFLYSKMLDHSRRLEAKSVNVGSSPSRGHYDFKRKWGGKVGVPPYYLVRWARGLLARRCYSAWGPRLIKL